MANAYYTPSGAPSTSSQAVSSTMRAEFTLLQAAFDLLPTISGNASKIVQVNSGATALTVLGTTGSGNAVLATSPTLVTPVIGAATGTSLSVTGQLTSTVATGTAPLVVSSTTQVANLYVARAALADSATAVVTNANLTGPITSSGNATAVASQTGTGNKFVMDTSPTLVTPNIGAATGTSLSVSGQLTSTVATGTAPLAVSSTTKVTNLYADRAATSDTTSLNANLTGVVTSSGSNATSFANGSVGPGSGAVVLATSNTPAWTPTPTSVGGAFGSQTVNTARAWKVGPFAFFELDFTINTVGGASGAINVTLPFTPITANYTPRGRDTNNGVGLMGTITAGSATMSIVNDANSSAIQANARITISGFYEPT